MRIIGGSNKGRKLLVPPTGLRPTTDRVREALFNILGALNGLRVADLYAGSGAFGLEAFSRGAAELTFVEKNPRACKTIRSNLQAVQCQANLHCAAVKQFLRKVPEKVFDIVFMDPPYHAVAEHRSWLLCDFAALLAEKGLIIVETAADEASPQLPGLMLFDERIYGGTALHFYRRSVEDEGGQ